MASDGLDGPDAWNPDTNSEDQHNANSEIAHLRVFVGGLLDSVTQAEVRQAFSSCGSIKDVILNKDGAKVFAFVTFETAEAKEK